MANNDDFDLDDFDLDDFDIDIPDFDAPPIKDDRSPSKRFTSALFKGAKKSAFSQAGLERLMRSALHPGYAQALNFKDSAIDNTRELYQSIVEELRPASHVIGRSSERLLESAAFKKRAPKFLQKRLANMAEAAKYAETGNVNYAALKAQQQQNEISSVLGELFKQQAQLTQEQNLQSEAKEQIREGVNQKLHRTELEYQAVIARGMDRLVGYQDGVLSKYQQKSLELQYRHFFVARESLEVSTKSFEKISLALDSITKNTGLPEALKIQRSEMAGQLLKERLINAGLDSVGNYSRNYLRNVTQNLRNTVSGAISGFTSGADSIPEGMDKGQLLGGAAGDALAGYAQEYLGNLINPRLEGNRKLRSGNAFLRDKLTGLTQKADKYAKSETEGFGWMSTFTQMMKDVMPRFYLNDKAGSMGLQDVDRPAIFDNRAHRSLVEIIPAHLSEIERYAKAIATGELGEARRFNYNRGGFTTEKQLQADIRRTILPRGTNVMLQREFDDLINNLDKDGTLSDDARKALKRQMLEDAATGQDFGVTDYAKRDRYKSVGDEEIIEQLREFFASQFEVGLDGTVNEGRSLEAKERFADSKVAFNNVANLVPATGDRVRALVNIYGRDELAKMGIIVRVGREDKIDNAKLFDMMMSEKVTETDREQYRTTAERENRYKGMTLQERLAAERNDRLKQINRKATVGPGDELPPSMDYNGPIVTGRGIRAGGSHSVAVSIDAGTFEPWLGEDSVVVRELRDIRRAITGASSLEPAAGTLAVLRRIEAMLKVTTVIQAGGTPDAAAADQSGGREDAEISSKVGRYLSDLSGRIKGGFNAARTRGGDTGNRNRFSVLRMLGTGTKKYIGFWKNVYKTGFKLGYKGAGGALSLDVGSLRGVKNTLMSRAKEAAVFVQGKTTPVITEAMLKSKELIDVNSGKVITKLDDITGEVKRVWDGREETIISAEEYAKGLYNKHGKPLVARAAAAYGRYMMLPWKAARGVATGALGLLRGKRKELSEDKDEKGDSPLTKKINPIVDYGRQGLGLAKDLALVPFAAGAGALRKARSLLGKMTGMFSGKASSGVRINLTGNTENDLVQIGVAQLSLLEKLYSILASKKTKHDGDGDGIRDGSVADLLRRRKAKKEEDDKKDPAKDPKARGALGKMMAGLASLFGGLLGKKDGDEEDGDTTIVGAAGTGLWDKTKKLGKKAGKGLLKGAGAILRAGWWATKFLGRTVIWNGLVALTGVVAGIIGSPVIAGVLVGAVAIGAVYAGYRYLTSNYRPVLSLRMAQYGFADSDKKPVTQLLWIEDYLEGSVAYSANGAQLKVSQQQVTEIMQHFGHNLKEINEPEVTAFVRWFEDRFKPVYLKHQGTRKDLGITGKLFDVDANIPAALGEEYITAVKLSEINYDDLSNSPFTFAELSEDRGDVESLVDKAIEYFRKKRKEATQALDKDKRVLGEVAPAVAAGVVGGRGGVALRNKAIADAAARHSVNIVQAGLTTRGLIGGTGVALESVKGERPLVINREGMKLGLDEAARFTIYGLRDMETEKVDTLRALEMWHYERVAYSPGNVATLNVNYDQVMGQFLVRFGVALTDGDAKGNWNTWYRYRFLPVFLAYCTGVRTRENINAAEAGTRLKPAIMRSVLMDASQAKSNYKGTSVSIWAIGVSPWPGYAINNDATQLTAYLEAFKALTREKVYPTDIQKLTGRDPAKGPRSVGDKDNVPLPLKAYRDGTVTRRTNYMERAVQGIRKGNQAGGGVAGKSMMLGGGAGGTLTSTGRAVQHPGGGTGGDINQLPEPKGDGWAQARGVIMGAAQIVGFDPVISSTVAAKESGFRPFVKNPLSSATGYFQFIDSTWKEMMGKYAAKYGINPTATQLDARANAILGVQYLKDNYNTLKKSLKREITDTDLYLAHFLGPGGAIRFLGAPGDDLASRHVNDNVPGANPSIFTPNGRPATVSQVYRSFDKDLVSRRSMHDAADNPLRTAGTYAPDAVAANDATAFDGAVPAVAPEDMNDASVAKHNLPIGVAPLMTNQPAKEKAGSADFVNQSFTPRAFGNTRAAMTTAASMTPPSAGTVEEGVVQPTQAEVHARTLTRQSAAKEEEQFERSKATAMVQEQMLQQQTRAADLLEQILGRVDAFAGGQVKAKPAAGQTLASSQRRPEQPPVESSRGTVSVKRAG